MSEQEDTLYGLIEKGDSEQIEDLRVKAFADQSIDQFESDYRAAYSRYQADNEMSEEEREQAAAEAVKKENQEAPTEEV